MTVDDASLSPEWFVMDKLLRCWNPFKSCVWDLQSPITRWEVRRAVRENNLLSPEKALFQSTRREHIRRVAWFVAHGWTDPIDLDVGCPGLPGYRSKWAILDGNHRYASAAVRGDRLILANASGSVQFIRTFQAFEGGMPPRPSASARQGVWSGATQHKLGGDDLMSVKRSIGHKIQCAWGSKDYEDVQACFNDSVRSASQQNGLLEG